MIYEEKWKKKCQQINKLKLIAWTRTWPFLSGLREVFASRSQMYVVQSQGKEKIVNLSLFFKAKRIPKDPCWPEISVSSPWLLPWDLFFLFTFFFPAARDSFSAGSSILIMLQITQLIYETDMLLQNISPHYLLLLLLFANLLSLNVLSSFPFWVKQKVADLVFVSIRDVYIKIS